MNHKAFQSFCSLGVAAVVFLIVTTCSSGGEASEEIRSTKAYIVKEGDTLWDISKRFSGSPSDWPKVWGRNPYIKNPHWIYPGDPIYLYTEITPVAPLPPPRPEKEEMGEVKEPKELPLSMPLTELYLSGILSEEDLGKVGGVVGSFEDKELLAQGDLIYIQFKGDEKTEVGQRYGIFRTGRTLYHPRTGAPLGKVYKIMGYAEILRQGDDRVASARIVSSRDVIQVGDGVKMFEPAPKQLVFKPSTRPLEGYVVASLEDQDEIAEHDIVFITLGVQDGIEVGNELSVMEGGKAVKGYADGGEVRLPVEKVAKLVVVKTDRTASAALVTGSRKSFSSGAMVRTSASQPAQ